MIRGTHVTLRAIQREDLPWLAAFNNDLDVELAGGGDPPMPQSLARLEVEFDENAGKGGRDGIKFSIEADNKFIGQCSLFNQNHVAQTAELGIGIGDKDYWGRGYGREAINLLLEFGFQKHNIRRIYLRVEARNERAMKAYSACGFVEEGRLREHVWNNGRFDDLVYMGILRKEWQQDSKKS